MSEIPLCAICHEDLEDTDNIPVLSCNHKFHDKCLVEVCNYKNNVDVSCPICRSDITQTCMTINPITPFVNKHLDIGEYGAPDFNWRMMSVEERKEADKIVKQCKKNFRARRKRAMALETPQQLAQREQIEQAYLDRINEERHRLYYGAPQTAYTSNSIGLGGRKTKKSNKSKGKRKRKSTRKSTRTCKPKRKNDKYSHM